MLSKKQITELKNLFYKEEFNINASDEKYSKFRKKDFIYAESNNFTIDIVKEQGIPYFLNETEVIIMFKNENDYIDISAYFTNSEVRAIYNMIKRNMEINCEEQKKVRKEYEEKQLSKFIKKMRGVK